MKRKIKNKKHKSELTLRRFVPNLITIIALCVGLSSVKFALVGRLDLAVICIMVASILDGMDGRIARIMGLASHFGAELDSLADFVNFGVAPSIVVYIVSLKNLGDFGWAISLFFAICSGLRLARFNTAKFHAHKKEEEWEFDYSVGVPAPAGALVAVLNFTIYQASGNEMFLSPYISGFLFLLSGGLMVSRIKTYVFKNIKIRPSNIRKSTMIATVLVISILSSVWWTVTVLGVLYLITIPISQKSYDRKSLSREKQDIVQDIK